MGIKEKLEEYKRRRRERKTVEALRRKEADAVYKQELERARTKAYSDAAKRKAQERARMEARRAFPSPGAKRSALFGGLRGEIKGFRKEYNQIVGGMPMVKQIYGDRIATKKKKAKKQGRTIVIKI